MKQKTEKFFSTLTVSKLVFIISVCFAMLQYFFWATWGRSIGWDEYEFARATQWIAEGKIPYLNFWEHHTPLHWFIFAPIARISGINHVSDLLFLRVIHAVFWLIGFFSIYKIAQKEACSILNFSLVVIVLFSATFILWAVEYRSDTLSTIFLVSAISVWRCFPLRWGRLFAGVLLAATILSNLRSTPTALCTMAILGAISTEKTWKIDRSSFHIGIGFIIPFSIWGIYLLATHSFVDAWRILFSENQIANKMMSTENYSSLLNILTLSPKQGDIVGTLLLASSILLSFAHLRKFRTPDIEFILSVVQLIQYGMLAKLSIHYPYHLQSILYVSILQLILWTRHLSFSPLTIAASICITSLIAALHAYGGHTHIILRNQQNFEAELRHNIQLDQTLFDGVGYSLEHQPSCDYWFMPYMSRLLARSHPTKCTNSRSIMKSPPGGIVITPRVINWFGEWPDVYKTISAHYVPAAPNFWVPCMNANIPKEKQYTWTVPKSAIYKVVSSKNLANHPWFYRPIAFYYSEYWKRVPWQISVNHFDSQTDLTVHSPNNRQSKKIGSYINLKVHEQISIQNNSDQNVGVFLIPTETKAIFTIPTIQSTIDTDLFSLWGRKLEEQRQ